MRERPDPDTVQGMLAQQRRLRPDPIQVPLPDGTTRKGVIDAVSSSYWGDGGGSVELRLYSEGASTLGLGATVTVHFPEVRWERAKNFTIRPGRVVHSSSGGEDRGDTEASLILLTLAKELRDQLNAEADEALAPIREAMERYEREAAERRAFLTARQQAVAARFRSFMLFGAKVRLTLRDGSRLTGTLLENEATILLEILGDKQRSTNLQDVALFEVKRGSRFVPFELEPKEVAA